MTRPSSSFPYRIESLNAQHDRVAFSSGVEALDRYFRTQAGQDVRRRVASCFVLVEADGRSVAGYYTLSASSIVISDLPPEVAAKVPRYPVVPATLIGRLAVRSDLRGRRLGELLLLDGLSRCLRAEVASFALIVDAKDGRAEAFYSHYGFRRLVGGGRRLFLPMTEAAALLT